MKKKSTIRCDFYCCNRKYNMHFHWLHLDVKHSDICKCVLILKGGALPKQ